MKLFIFKTSPGWGNAGGLAVVAKEFKNCKKLLKKYQPEIGLPEDPIYTLCEYKESLSSELPRHKWRWLHVS